MPLIGLISLGLAFAGVMYLNDIAALPKSAHRRGNRCHAGRMAAMGPLALLIFAGFGVA